jgi:hypothetical protein
MNDWQGEQEPRSVRYEKTGSGRVSLTIAKCVWAFLLIAVIAFYVLYWINWAALFLVLMLLFPLMNLVPIVAALGVYFGLKDSEADDEREARIGIALNAIAFIVGAVFILLK